MQINNNQKLKSLRYLYEEWCLMEENVSLDSYLMQGKITTVEKLQILKKNIS